MVYLFSPNMSVTAAGPVVVIAAGLVVVNGAAITAPGTSLY